jgi:hypothetical protein
MSDRIPFTTNYVYNGTVIKIDVVKDKLDDLADLYFGSETINYEYRSEADERWFIQGIFSDSGGFYKALENEINEWAEETFGGGLKFHFAPEEAITKGFT